MVTQVLRKTGTIGTAGSGEGNASGTPVLSIPIDDDLAARLAAFACRNPDFATPEDAARHILRHWLAENGYNGSHEDAGTRPEALNASNDD